MKVVVHHNGTSAELPLRRPPETWGRLCQRHCEGRLLHPPRLLQLLASLSPDGRADEYLFRYGDGRATIVKPRWSEASRGGEASGKEGEGERVEANLALRPRGGPLAKIDDLTPLEAAFPAGANGMVPEKMAVELRVEKVGMGADEDGGPFPLTQTPYPVDDARTNVLEVMEHARFAGVVDRFSLARLDEWRSNREAEGEATEAGAAEAGKTATSGRNGEKKKSTEAKDDASQKRKEMTEKASAKTKESSKKKKEKASSKTEASKKKSKREVEPQEEEERPPKKKRARQYAGDAGTAPASPPANPPSVPRSAPAKGRASAATTGAGAATTNGKRQGKGRREEKVKRPLNGYMRFCAEVRPGVMRDHPALKAVEVSSILGERYRALDDGGKKRYTDAAREALEKFKAEHPDLPRGSRKKKAAATEDETGEASGSEEEEETENPPTVAKKKKRKKKRNDKDGSEGNDDEEPAKPKPKRPLNAYTAFMKDAIHQIREENPGVPQKEVMAKANEAYRELSDDERKRYKDTADAAKAKFLEEHGEDAMRRGPRQGSDEAKVAKKKRKKSKEAAKAESDSDGDAETDGEEPAKAKPKRPLNGYMIFMKEILPEMKAKHPDLPQKEVMGKAAEAYRELSEDERKRYKDKADAAKAQFLKEHGEDALKRGKRKNKQSVTNGSARKRADSVGSHPTEAGMTHIASEPAKGLPEGWVTRAVPRKSGDKSDIYWFSPGESYKFRSMAEVKRYRKSLKRADGDEVAAMKLFKEGEKGGKGKRQKTEAVKEEVETVGEGDSGSEKDPGGSDGSDEDEEPEAWGA
ncbi:hypothetical protein ACHAXT_002603 [Thalassiosira profunda]